MRRNEYDGVNLSPYQKAWLNRQRQNPITVEAFIPERPFFWTLDQVATMLAIGEKALRSKCYFARRSTGVRTNDHLFVVNIADKGDRPDWRVQDNELRRWLAHKSVVLYPPYDGRTTTPPQQGDNQ